MLNPPPYIRERIGNDPFYLGIAYRGMPVGATAQIGFSMSLNNPNAHYQHWNGSVWVDIENGQALTIPTTHTAFSALQFYTLNVQLRLKPGSVTGPLDYLDAVVMMPGASNDLSIIRVKSQA